VIVCDFYIVTDDRDGIYIGPDQPETPTPAGTATATATAPATVTATATTTVTSLPNTGAGDAPNETSLLWLLALLGPLFGGLMVALRMRNQH
jgi:hypothetical protein